MNGRALSWRGRLAAVLLLAGGVAGAAPKEAWLKVTTPELTIITPLAAKEATTWASEFSQYVAALRTFFNGGKVRLPPLTVVIFKRPRDFQAYFPLLAPGGKPQQIEGFFSRRESWAVVGLSQGASEDTRRTIFHEGVHWFLSTTNTLNPVWLEEGLAEVFSTFRTEKTHAEWGRPVEDHVMLLRSMRPLPLEKLLFTARGDLFGNDSVRTGIVYAESWAFVHMLVFGKHDIPRSSFADYTEALSSGRHPDEAFRKAFGRTYAGMDRMLEQYLASGAYYVARQPLAAVEPPTSTPATLAEMENALGRLAFAGQRYPQAIAHGRAAVAAGPDDPAGYELLGTALDASDQTDEAQAAFKAAIARGSKDFQPYFEVGVAAHNAAVKETEELTGAQAREIANRYEQAILLYPRFRATYENLAGVIGVAEPWSSEDRRFLELGLRFFPDCGAIEVGLAQLMRRAGDLAGARQRVDRVLASRTGLTMAGTQFAHRLSVAWETEEIRRQVDQLGREGKFAEAIAFLDERLAAGVDSIVRKGMVTVRMQLEGAKLAKDLRAALEAREWTEARRLVSELLASDASPMLKAQARRTLSDLDTRRLGVRREQP